MSPLFRLCTRLGNLSLARRSGYDKFLILLSTWLHVSAHFQYPGTKISGKAAMQHFHFPKLGEQVI